MCCVLGQQKHLLHWPQKLLKTQNKHVRETEDETLVFFLSSMEPCVSDDIHFALCWNSLKMSGLEWVYNAE